MRPRDVVDYFRLRRNVLAPQRDTVLGLFQIQKEEFAVHA